MVRINLQPQPDRKRRAAAVGGPLRPRFTATTLPLPLLGGFFLLVLLAGVVFVYFNQNRQLAGLEERIDVAQQDSTRYSRAIGKIRQIESSQSSLVARIQAIQSVDRGRFRWAHILEELSRSLPEHTWLTSVVAKEGTGAEGSGAGGAVDTDQIEITGITYSNLTLPRFMTSLESSPFLEQVSLIGSNRSRLEGIDVISFALVATYTQPPSS